MLLRLIEVPQLLEGSKTFPGANHTRYEHSLGTYELMRKAIISLLRNKSFINYFSERTVVIGLLSSLLSSVINFPYSYAIFELQLQEPELYLELSKNEIFDKIINYQDNNKNLLDTILLSYDNIELDLDLNDIKYVLFGKGDDINNQLRNKELDIINKILNSSIGVRIMDYIMRDSHHIGIAYRIDPDNLFNNLLLHDNEFIIRQSGLTYAEQIIINRYWMFKRIYWNEPNRAYIAILKNVFYNMYNEEFAKNLLNQIPTSNEHNIQNFLITSASDDNKIFVQRSLKYLDKNSKDVYQRILVLDKNSQVPGADRICKDYSTMLYSHQNIIREKIEESFINKFKIPDAIINNGAVILIDMPYEKIGNKLGDDIKVLRYDNVPLPIEKVSGVISGLKQTFDDHLRILRIYLRPDIFEHIKTNYSIEEGRNFIIEEFNNLI